MNEARLRMTRIPKGADLILNKVSGAPGFWIGNVIVMAGVPSIMPAMLDEVAPKLQIGVRMLSEIVRADTREGDIGTQLGEIAKANLGVTIGSYPFFCYGEMIASPSRFGKFLRSNRSQTAAINHELSHLSTTDLPFGASGHSDAAYTHGSVRRCTDDNRGTTPA